MIQTQAHRLPPSILQTPSLSHFAKVVRGWWESRFTQSLEASKLKAGGTTALHWIPFGSMRPQPPPNVAGGSEHCPLLPARASLRRLCLQTGPSHTVTVPSLLESLSHPA